MPGKLSVHTETVQVGKETVAVLHIEGSIDGSSSDELDGAFDAAADGGGSQFILDFSEVDYISSAGLRLLLRFRRIALDRGGRLRIASVHREIRENVLDALGFSRLIDVYADVQEATDALHGKDG